MAVKLNNFSFQSLPSVALLPARAQRSPKSSITSTIYSSSKGKAMSSGRAGEANVNVVRPMLPPKNVEIFKSMEDWVRSDILILLKPVEKSWQPHDFLPNPTSDGFIEQVNELRERAKDIPDDYFVVLVGDMIVEEALPSYHTLLGSSNIFYDETGCDNTPWATWARGWSAEENRHGDLLNKYLFLSGRVEMKQIEKTTQYLIGSGTDFGPRTSPSYLTIYTSFQERATFISHANTAKLAMKYGDKKLAQICGTIAADEKRHETAYTKIAGKFFELDPNEAIIAFSDLLRRKVSMPGHLMYDGNDENLFYHFSNVCSRIGVYTARDYVTILEHFVGTWNVEKLSGLSSEGREAQDYVGGLLQRLRSLEERAQARAKKAPAVPFSWISGREV